MKRIALKNASLLFSADFLSSTEAKILFNTLLASTRWQQEAIHLFGRKVNLPRLTAWHGAPGLVYEYSGIRVSPQRWTQPLLDVKNQLEEKFSANFNSVLINRYRDGRDSVDWHADDEPSLSDEPTIASLSLGATRRFTMKHRYDQNRKFELNLTDGSALLMTGTSQRYWLHKIPKTRKTTGERINMTFRTICGD